MVKKKAIKLLCCVLVVFVCATTFVSCSQSSKVDSYVETLNKNQPEMSNPEKTFTGVKKENNKLVVEVKLDLSFAEIGMTAEMFAEGEREIATTDLLASSSGDEEKELLTAVVDEGCSIVYRYIDRDGEVAEIEIPNCDIMRALKNK
ncbi:MAG: hypothetical protein II260_02535 [Muribaculaceae bacterium]|nr:hypothetical protein [Muribaculaceae bacterium]